MKKKRGLRGGARPGSGRMKRYGEEPVTREMIRFPASVKEKLLRRYGKKMKRPNARGEAMYIQSLSDAIVDLMDRRE
jgi:hypothetical protein